MKSMASGQPVNYFRHTSIFFNIIRDNDALHHGHVALYLALIHMWNKSYFRNPMILRSEEAMAFSRITSKSTFFRILRQLECFDLIRFYKTNSKYSSSYCLISQLEYKDQKYTITILILQGRLSCTESNDSALVTSDQGRADARINLETGTLIPVVLKTISIPAKNNTPSTPADAAAIPWHPDNDPRYSADVIKSISSPLNSFSNDQHHAPKQRGSSLRPSGIQPDPNADYSIPL